MKLSEIDYSNNFNDLYIDLKNYINTDNHVVFLDSNLSSILNLDENLNIFEIDINESTKGLETIQKLWAIMFDQSLDRNSKVIGIGGGVLSDLVGFATSTFKRGAKLCLIPSTLLGMVDAAHGGKNGFNNDYGKNQIGTFFIPEKILICSEFLDSLSENELNNGIIESIKAGLLGDRTILDLIYVDNFMKNIDEIIKKSVKVKNSILHNDIEESNERMFLNLGHTIGHLIEKDSDFSVSHGQAVAIGILKGLEIAETKYHLDNNVKHQFEDFLNKKSLKTDYKFSNDINYLKEIISNDKKVSNDVIKFVLIQDIEKPILIDLHINDLLEVLING